MTVFKYFLKLAWGRKFIILVYLVVFVAISYLNSSGINQNTEGFIPTVPDIRIIQEEDSPTANYLTDWLRKENNEQDMDITEEYAEEAIFNNAVDAVIVIPEGFEENFRNGREAVRVYTDDRQMTSLLLTGNIQKYLMFLKADETTYGTPDPARIEAALAVESSVTLAEVPQNGSNETMMTWFGYYFNFMTYIIIAIYIMVFGLIMSEFNEENLKRRNSLIPMSSTRFQLGIVLAQLLLASVITSIFLAIGWFMGGMEGHGLNWPAHILNAFVFSLAALALAFLINSLTRKAAVHSTLSTLLSLGTAFISGVMVPSEFLSPTVVNLSKFFPTYYYVQVTDAIMTGESYLPGLGIQLLFALFFLVLGLTIARIRQGEDILSMRARDRRAASTSAR